MCVKKVEASEKAIRKRKQAGAQERATRRLCAKRYTQIESVLSEGEGSSAYFSEQSLRRVHLLTRTLYVYAAWPYEKITIE